MSDPTQSAILHAARRAIVDRRAESNAAIGTVVSNWRQGVIAAVIDALAEDGAADSLALHEQVARVLEDMRVEVDMVIHADGVCVEVCAAIVRLYEEVKA